MSKSREIRLCWTRSETNGESFERCPATKRKAIRWEASRRKTRPGRLTKPAVKICKSIMVERSGIRDCAIIIRRGAEKLELSSKNLDSTPPPKQKKLVLTPPLLC